MSTQDDGSKGERAQFPDSNGFVGASGQEPTAVGTDSHHADPTLVGSQDRWELVQIGKVPDADALVGDGGGEPLIVG